MAKSFKELARVLIPNTLTKIFFWGCALKPVLQWLVNLINNASNLDFTISAGGNPRVMAVWHFLNSTQGNLLFMAIGFGFLALFVWQKARKLESLEQQKTDVVEKPKSETNNTPAPEKPARILKYVGSKWENVKLEDNGILSEAEESDESVLLVGFRLVPQKNSESRVWIRVTLTFKEPEGEIFYRIKDAIWWENMLNEEIEKHRIFDRGDEHDLIFGVVQKSKERFISCEHNTKNLITNHFMASNLHLSPKLGYLDGKRFQVEAEFVGEANGDLVLHQVSNFELVIARKSKLRHLKSESRI